MATNSNTRYFDPVLLNIEYYIYLGTLVMNNTLAIEIVQQSHINLLRSLAGNMRADEVLQYRLRCPRGPCYELLIIDDHIGLQRIKCVHPPEFRCQIRDHEISQLQNGPTNKLNCHLAKYNGKLGMPLSWVRKFMICQVEFRFLEFE